MNNLSFHITDITANSIRANASEIGLSVEEQDTRIVIRITDNGSGMDAETARRVTNPFYTTRTTRKVGLGLPFLIQNAEQTNEIKEILDGVPLSHPKVMLLIKEMIKENIRS